MFSKNLKYLRLSNGLSQEDIGKIVGKDRSLISQWESEDKNVTVDDIIKISNYFNITMDDLIGKDLTKENNNINLSQKEILFNKTKDILSESDWATIEFIMNKTIAEYEKQKDKND